MTTAIFSPDRKYRYRLDRLPADADSAGTVNFIMLNPSIADETQDDPTVRRCIGYTRLWRYRHLIVTNIFALRSTDPAAIRKELDPVGPENDMHLATAAQLARRVVAAWGNHGLERDRGREVKRLLQRLGVQVHVLALTGQGQPVHPLYQPADRQLVVWIPRAVTV